MRLFIAIDFPLEVKKEITSSIKQLTSQFPQVAWTKEENLHLTLKFLGNIKEKNQIPISNVKSNPKLQIQNKIEEGIKKSVEGIEKFELVFTEVGYFEREQLIIWLGLKQNDTLKMLVGRLEAEMAKLGFPKEKRIFTPHITVGRGKRLEIGVKKELKEKITNEKFILPKTFSVSEVVLMNSLLGSSGPRYNKVSSFSLL